MVSSAEFIIVSISFDDAHKADEMAGQLVQAGLAACVQRQQVFSTYKWQGQVESSDEWILQIKTRSELFDDICAYVRARHSYETPEILATAIVGVSADYADWMRSETNTRQTYS